jgi:phosphatidylethanolamine/phosphatidyl-N-methylethanolamine N-methyltransferase
MLFDIQLFLKEFWGSFSSTGAILPSSPSLARAILKPLRQRPKSPIRILEVGPGTGAFTFTILKHLKQGDALYIYELNDRFYDYLRQRLSKINTSGIDIKLFHRDVLTLKEDIQFDYIISSLPFSNFNARTIKHIMDMYLSHLTSQGTLSYFEYLLPHRLRIRFLNSNQRLRVQRMLVRLKKYTSVHQVAYSDTWLNVPPARAHHLQVVNSKADK